MIVEISAGNSKARATTQAYCNSCKLQPNVHPKQGKLCLRIYTYLYIYIYFFINNKVGPIFCGLKVREDDLAEH